MDRVFECGVTSQLYFDKCSISVNRENLENFNECDQVNLYYYDFGRKIEKTIPKNDLQIKFWCADYIILSTR